HPDVSAESIKVKFPGLTLSEIEREQRTIFAIGEPVRYSETGTADDNGDHTPDGDYKAGNETKLTDKLGKFAYDLAGYSGVSEWSREASWHDYDDRFFADRVEDVTPSRAREGD